MNSLHGCASLNTGPLGMFVDDYYLVFAIPSMVLGLFLVVYGGQYPKTSMFIITTFSLMTVLLLLLWMYYLPETSPEWVVWVTLINCLFIGGGVGVAAAYYPRFGIELIGAMMGMVVGFTAYKIVEVLIPEGNMTLAIGLLLAIGAVGGIAIAFAVFDHVMIICSATIGSYALIRGLSLCIGGYPGEIEMSMARNNDELNMLPQSTFWYITFMILVLILSLVG